MIPHNLLTALPFWDKMKKQSFRQPYAGTDIGAIECRYDRMLPFTIKHTPAAAPNFIYLVRKDGLRAINFGTLISASNTTVDGKGYIFYSAGSDHNQATSITEYSADGSNPTIWDVYGTTTWADWVCDGGLYYLEISIGSSRYYSELMRISDFPETTADPTNPNVSRVKIEGTNLCAVGDLPATLNANKLFIDGNTSDPQYVLEKEVAKDGQDEESPVWVKLKKRYRVRFHAIEPVADWVASLPLYGDNVNLTDQYGYQAAITDIEVDVSWPEQFNGHLALVEMSYTITYLSQTGCCS